MRYGDLVTLKTGETVRVNSIDENRRVFDYLKDEENEWVTVEASFDDLAD